MKSIHYSCRTLLVLAAFLLLLTGCERRKTIVNRLDEKEANEIIVFLSTKGIDTQKVISKEGGGGAQKEILFDITVPQASATEALSILNRSGLPRRRGRNLLGIFSDVGLVPSEMQERIRYQAGIGEQIAGVIRKIDGVLDAEVQISFPEEDPLNPGKTKGDIVASVYVKHSGVLDDPNSHLITKIKSLVMSSVTGLKFERVTVVADRARFSEFAPGLRRTLPQEEKKFVRIWTTTIAKESIARFRLLFFSFSLAILLLILVLIWLGWKIYPILKKQGGIAVLFQLAPLEMPDQKGEETEEEEEEEEEKEEEEEEEERNPKDVT